MGGSASFWTSRWEGAGASSSRVGKCRYRVALATPALLAIAFREASGDAVSASSAAARIASRLRRASLRLSSVDPVMLGSPALQAGSSPLILGRLRGVPRYA